MTQLYVYPKFDGIRIGSLRIGGPGLGNLLFPWARAQIIAKTKQAKYMEPVWAQVKPFRLLRLDRDTRNYRGIFRRDPKSIGQMEAAIALAKFNRISEAQYGAGYPRDGLPCVINVCGMGDLFVPLSGYSESLRAALIGIAKGYCTNDSFKLKVAIHVRLGDFSQPTQALQPGAANTRIPLAWYASAIRVLASAFGKQFDVSVYSDGTDAELHELLAMPNVTREGCGNAVLDLLGMSDHLCLIASGSTYSMWAAFLGQRPTIWYPGQLKPGINKTLGRAVEFDPFRKQLDYMFLTQLETEWGKANANCP